MKRKFAILLSAMLLTQAVCGCGGAAPSGTSSASASTGSIASKSSEKAVIVTDEQEFTHENGITRLAKEIYGDLNVEFFVLSEDTQERETQISSLRVEIMAGGGPDGYLLSSPTSNMTFNGEGRPAALFPDVQRTMQAGAFLPLDDYIKESEYLRSEDHFAPVFDTGKTDEGQVVLPITYYASVFLLDKAQLADPDFTPKTWDELVNCEDTAVLKVVRNNLYTWCGAGIPRIADYATEKTILTEENLTAQFEDLLAMPASESIDEETALIQRGSYAQTDEGMAYYAQNKDTVNAFAIPNTEGGVTAFITSYAAINRNSPKADEMFRFFELLFSDEAQIDTETVNDARGTLLMLGNLNSFLTHKNAYLQPELLESVQSRVNAVRFYSVMDYTIYDTATTLTWEENPDCAAAAHSVIEALQTRLSE
ncbi:MAG: extracellular solute-binding protein [Hominenteromicrobium mulieris]